MLKSTTVDPRLGNAPMNLLAQGLGFKVLFGILECKVGARILGTASWHMLYYSACRRFGGF